MAIEKAVMHGCRPLRRLLKTTWINKSLNLYQSTMDAKVRVRFAPSPTGQLHLGGLRSALYNFLFARSNNGTMILRVEDTDQTRIVEGATEKLQEMLQWTGIEIDEGPFTGGSYGPYIQSQRLLQYQEMIDKLLQNGSAYRCFCTPHRLDLLRKDALRRQETPKYDNRCRHLTTQEINQKLQADEAFVVRLKLLACEPWTDMIYGSISTDVAAIEGDPVLLKTDKYPTYHLANVVDDHLMRITHVLRGVEWQVSTAKHLMLYKAFNWTPPVFAHLPLLLNKDGKKLSKRENSIHVESLKNEGYLPEAVLNFITYSGSGFNVPQKELAGCTMKDLIKHFNLAKMNTNSTRLDFERLGELNQLHLNVHLQRAVHDNQELQVMRSRLSELLTKNGLPVDLTVFSKDYMCRVFSWLQHSHRVNVLSDLMLPAFQFLWLRPTREALSRLHKVACNDVLRNGLGATISKMTELPDDVCSEEMVRMTLKEIPKQGIDMKGTMKILRIALQGQESGPPVSELIAVLGRQETLHRLQSALHQLEKHNQRAADT